ncbi:MAG: CcmD family protein [Chloroflexota bacterium]
MNYLQILQETVTPDTTDFMLLGYGVIFVVMAIYMLSLFNRTKKLEQELVNLEEMD